MLTTNQDNTPIVLGITPPKVDTRILHRDAIMNNTSIARLGSDEKLLIRGAVYMLDGYPTVITKIATVEGRGTYASVLRMDGVVAMPCADHMPQDIRPATDSEANQFMEAVGIA